MAANEQGLDFLGNPDLGNAQTVLRTNEQFFVFDAFFFGGALHG
jgi:hypothetical protein